MSYICVQCIKEPGLQNLASPILEEADCDYCQTFSRCCEIQFIAEQCNDVINNFFECTSTTDAVVIYERTPAGSDLSDILQEITAISDLSIIEDIAEALSELWHHLGSGDPIYGDNPWFIAKSDIEYPLSREWNEIETSLRCESRYLNPKVKKFLDEIFGDLEHCFADGGKSVLVNAGPNTEYTQFYRARVFQNQRNLESALEHPERNLGAPPEGLGAGGRMNAPGQPAFYGATDEATALSEVRPPVGSNVVCAAFEIIRPLVLLDIKLLENIEPPYGQSIFDPDTLIRSERRSFLKVLSVKMTAPVMPENQDRDYLITQVIADYLAMHPSLNIDGILFPSVQTNAKSNGSSVRNVVLFHKSAMTLNSDLINRNASVQMMEYEENYAYFSPTIYFKNPKDEFDRTRIRSSIEPALKLVLKSIAIHKITSVAIQTEKTNVQIIESHSKK